MTFGMPGMGHDDYVVGGGNDDERYFSQPITMTGVDDKAAKGLSGVMTFIYNGFPYLLLLADIGLSTYGFAAIFNQSVAFNLVTAFNIALSLLVSGGQMFMIRMIQDAKRQMAYNKTLPVGHRKPVILILFPVFGLILFWVIDQALDGGGYTFATTGVKEWAMHIFPPASEQSPLWWGGFILLWLLGCISEWVIGYRLRAGSMRAV